MKTYHFTTVQYLHNYSLGETINIGIVMWLPDDRRLAFRLNPRYGRLSSMYRDFDGASYRSMVKRLEKHFATAAVKIGDRQLSTQDAALADVQQIMHALVPEDASCFQWGPIMGGIAPAPDERLAQLFDEFVTDNDPRAPRARKDETDIWTRVEDGLGEKNIQVDRQVCIRSKDYEYTFQAGWVNGVRQVVEPISFDYLNAGDVVDKANTWSGRLYNLRDAPEFQLTAIVAQPLGRKLSESFDTAKRLLASAPRVRQVLVDTDIDELVRTVESDLASSSK